MPDGHNLSHLRLPLGKKERFKSPLRAIPPDPPERNRIEHAQNLEAQFVAAVQTLRERAEITEGYRLSFSFPKGHEQFIDSLENKKRKIEVLTSKELPDAISATVYIPVQSEKFFPSKLRDYETRNTKKTGRPKNNNLVARINAISAATFEDLFTGDFVPDANTSVTWEIWLRKEGTILHNRSLQQFMDSNQWLDFPERVIAPYVGSRTELEQLILQTPDIAEIRLNSVPGPLLPDLPNNLQATIATSIVGRTTFAGMETPCVCVLDTGVNRGHPMLEPAIPSTRVEAYDTAWGAQDTQGHGTGMTGLALFGDVSELVANADPVTLEHSAQSIKMIGPNANPAALYGRITSDCVSKAEISNQAPQVFCMAVTAEGNCSGKPSSWSGAIDKLCFGENDRRRLFLISAGNYRDTITPQDYPARNDNAAVEDPAQSWNSVVVGACTTKATFSPANSGLSVVSPPGALSPRSRTSVAWSRQWPVRPDVVMEGGNLANDGQMSFPVSELRLSTTNHDTAVSHFRDFGDTSGATALASRLAARLMARYPQMWPETVRGLIVHSAEWNDAMLQQVGNSSSSTTRNLLLRRYGYGQPNSARAMAGADSDVTLIIEDTIQPFQLKAGSGASNELVAHALPLPVDVLQSNPDSEVQLRVTLSYFIEPNPGRSWSRRHSYKSHSLRFALKRSTETLAAFRQRVNAAVESEDQPSGSGGDGWYLAGLRDKGSVHSDIWRGTAAELANRDSICVYPVGGWWRNNPSLGRVETQTYYSLLVSITVPIGLNIYTPIQTAIEQIIQITT